MKKLCIIVWLMLVSRYLYMNKRSDIKSQNTQITTKRYKNFSLDNVLKSRYGDIHYNAYIPKAYDKRQSYALYITVFIFKV